MRLFTAEHPAGTVEVHDDGQRSLRVLWAQDTKGNLPAWAGCNGEILDVDRHRAHLTRLRLIQDDPSLLGTKGEQKGCFRRSVSERLHLGF